MIENRPTHLLTDAAYCVRPPLPYRVDWTPVPDFVGRSIADLSGIQPVTGAMAKAAGGNLHDKPSEGELSLFRDAGVEFQLVWVVASLVSKPGEGEGFGTTPFALSLMPSQKRGKVQTVGVELLSNLEYQYDPTNPPLYSHFNPFAGTYGLFGMGTPGLAAGEGHLDEVGLVVGSYFLATKFDDTDVLAPDIGLPQGDAWTRYARHRRKLLFTPFRKPEPRRVWGAESPIELFLIQELARRGRHPQLQMLIMENGGAYPSYYHLWGDMEFRWSRAAVTEADLFFPEERVAVFCDGARFHRSAARQKKDDAVAARLREFGITPVRIEGRLIVKELATAADRVEEALAVSSS